jgi:hypothetical protein
VPEHRTLLRGVTGVNAEAHVRVGDRCRPGALWVALEPLACAGCGRPLRAGDLAVRGPGLGDGRTHDPRCTVACRPFHLGPRAAARLEPGTVLPPGTAVGDDPRCPCCRDGRRREARWRLREREAATANACSGSAAAVRAHVAPFLAGRAARPEGVKRRCGTVLQARAAVLDAVTAAAAILQQTPPHSHVPAVPLQALV